MDNNKEVIKFIDRLYRDLYKSDEVLHHAVEVKIDRDGKRHYYLNKTDKFNNLKKYLDMLTNMHDRVVAFERRKYLLKQLYHDRYVIKPNDIPESYYEFIREKELDIGKGHLTIDSYTKKTIQREVIADQENSLDRWLDYFLSEESKDYPFWAKYWAFQGMLKLGTYNQSAQAFNKRSKYTTAAFVELNKDVLNKSMDLIIKIVNKEAIDDEELNQLVKDGSFTKVYTYFFAREKQKLYSNEGIWVKYNKGGDYKKLATSLNGYNTNWCTKAEGTALAQLSCGDFYVYYTIDKNGEYKVPRLAIRMEDENIAEIRGILQNQNIEPELKDILEEKLEEFPDKDKYYKKVEHMERLTDIYRKQKKNVELTVDELRFLYEIDEHIVGFGHRHDPRVAEIIAKRDTYEDLSKIFGYDIKAREDNYISNISKGIMMDPTDPLFPKVTVRSLPFLDNINNMNYPDIVIGDIRLGGVESVRNTKLPTRVNGRLYSDGNIRSGSVYIGVGTNKTILENVIFPDEIGGQLSVAAKVMKDVKFSRLVHGDVSIKVENYTNITLPEEVEGAFTLDIKYVQDIELPKLVRKAITIKSLSPTIHSLKFPDICWSISLPDIIYGYGLVLPKMLQDDLELRRLTYANDMVLPETVGGVVDLSALVDGTDMVLPETIGEKLDISNLVYMEGMVLPKRINGDLHIPIKALDYYGRNILEDIVGGKIYFYDENRRLIHDEKEYYSSKSLSN